MSQPSPTRKPNSPNHYGSQKSLPTMATPRKPPPEKKLGPGGFIFFLLIMGGGIWLAMLIFGWGPYAQVGEVTATATNTLTTNIPAGPTATAILTPTPEPSLTYVPTITLTPTLETLPFVKRGDIETFNSDLLRPQLSCDWLVIAGQVWDLKDEPIPGLQLHLFGELGEYTIDLYRLSGSAKVYGDSGYEFLLENLVVDSENSLFIQLMETNGIPLSHPIAIQTFNDCQQNLILVNFKQVQ